MIEQYHINNSWNNNILAPSYPPVEADLTYPSSDKKKIEIKMYPFLQIANAHEPYKFTVLIFTPKHTFPFTFKGRLLPKQEVMYCVLNYGHNVTMGMYVNMSNIDL